VKGHKLMATNPESFQLDNTTASFKISVISTRYDHTTQLVSQNITAVTFATTDILLWDRLTFDDGIDKMSWSTGKKLLASIA